MEPPAPARFYGREVKPVSELTRPDSRDNPSRVACQVCASLGKLASWGDRCFSWVGLPMPSEVAKLEIILEVGGASGTKGRWERSDGELGRCPQCGNLYRFGVENWFETSDAVWVREWVVRLLPSEYSSERERAEALRRLEFDLLDSDPRIRAVAASLLNKDAGLDGVRDLAPAS